MNDQKVGEVKNGNGAAVPPKSKKERSPNYPSVDLKTAIAKLKLFYALEKKQSAPMLVAVKHLGHSSASGPARVLVSTLVKYGLMEEEGRGDDRKLKVSRLGLNIILDEQPISRERDEAIRQAALKPKIMAHLWGKYGTELPSEATTRTYLIRDLHFTDAAAGELIRVYKDSIEFAKLTGGGTITGGEEEGEDDGDEKEDRLPVKIGDYVQWTNAGQDQFSPLRRVRWVSDDGAWAAVDGSGTGMPVAELTVGEKPMDANRQQPPIPPAPPPADQRFQPAREAALQQPEREEEEWGVQPLRFPLSRGNVIEIRLKAPVTPKEFARIKKLIELSEDSFLISDDSPGGSGESKE